MKICDKKYGKEKFIFADRKNTGRGECNDMKSNEMVSKVLKWCSQDSAEMQAGRKNNFSC